MGMPASIKQDDELKERVQHLAEVRRRSARWIMREAVAQYVEREEKREAYKQDALTIMWAPPTPRSMKVFHANGALRGWARHSTPRS